MGSDNKKCKLPSLEDKKMKDKMISVNLNSSDTQFTKNNKQKISTKNDADLTQPGPSMNHYQSNYKKSNINSGYIDPTEETTSVIPSLENNHVVEYNDEILDDLIGDTSLFPEICKNPNPEFFLNCNHVNNYNKEDSELGALTDDTTLFSDNFDNPSSPNCKAEHDYMQYINFQ